MELRNYDFTVISSKGKYNISWCSECLEKAIDEVSDYIDKNIGGANNKLYFLFTLVKEF